MNAEILYVMRLILYAENNEINLCNYPAKIRRNIIASGL